MFAYYFIEIHFNRFDIGNFMFDLNKFGREEVQNFLRQNLYVQSHQISMLKSPFSDISSAELATQLKGLQIAKYKFPSLFKLPQIVYPPSIHLEQSSSESTADYKSQLVTGQNFLDATAGFGVDSLAFANRYQTITMLEKNTKLADIASHNFNTMGLTQVAIQPMDVIDFLKQNKKQIWDLIYIDPSRRKGSQKKFLLEDLEPDISKHIDLIFQNTPQILVKLSPLLDIQSTINVLKYIQEIHIVSVRNEVKELLVLLSATQNFNPKIVCVNLFTSQNIFKFQFLDETNLKIDFSKPLKYIYEPNVAISKSGGFKKFAETFNLKKLHPNTHLYTSENIISGIPAKIYVVTKILNSPKEIKSGSEFHVLSKNYPMKVDEIRKRYQLKEGEEISLIWTRSIEGKHLIVCERWRDEESQFN